MNVARTAGSCAAIASVTGFILSHMTGPQGVALLSRLQAIVPGLQGARAPSSADPVDRKARVSVRQPSPIQPYPGQLSPGLGGVLMIAPDAYGQYHADLEIEGRRVPALIDTGASWVSLSFEAAAALGFFPAPADFNLAMNTANGVTLAAPVTIPEVRVGPLVVRQVNAIVQRRGALSGALLGMSFLRGLSGFSIESNRLVLRQ